MDLGIDNIVLIASGKGGVGKSTVAVNVAIALANTGYATGLLDADIYGPSIPTMLGETGQKPGPAGETLRPYDHHGLKVMSMGYLVGPDVAMIWRGPMLASAALQLCREVAWGDLDYLIVDLPPGTGDIPLSLAQKLEVAGAVLVTTPQALALSDVVRAKAMFDRVGIENLGLVENMSHFVCPGCGDRHEIFATGGGERAARELDTPLLGQIPLEPEIRAAGDNGRPIVDFLPQSESARAFVVIAERLAEQVRSGEPGPPGRGRRLRIIQ